MNLGPTELILILVIVIVLFGVGRISKIGKEMGSGIRGFREGLQGDESKKTTDAAAKVETDEPEEPKA
jgi:sec-independent protein translocase protein TatA